MTRFKDIFKLSTKQVDFLFAHAHKAGSCYGIKLLYSPQPAPDQEHFPGGKVLIITPRKVGKAHQRNKLRRQIKSIIYQEQLLNYPGCFIILLYKSATELSYPQLSQFFRKHLKEVK